MPRGALDIIINGQDRYDVWETWNIALSDGAISTLLAPPPVKERISNKSRLEDGERIDTTAPVYYDSRDITLEMHLIAPDFTTFVNRYQSFFNVISKAKDIFLQFHIYNRWLRFHFTYVSCTQFGAYQGTLGKFALRLHEANPSMGGTV